MKVPIKDTNGADKGEQEAKFTPVDDDKGNQAVHEAVVAYNAAQRSGNACTKTVGEVAGTGAKPWRQKGTGRARTGSRRTPIFTGGGVAHGPKQRDYSKKVNTKTRRLALRKALTERINAGEVIVVDSLKLESHKTKALAEQIESLAAEGTVLLVNGEADGNLALAARNIPLVELVEAESLNTYEVLRPDTVIISKDALEKVASRLNTKES